MKLDYTWIRASEVYRKARETERRRRNTHQSTFSQQGFDLEIGAIFAFYSSEAFRLLQCVLKETEAKPPGASAVHAALLHAAGTPTRSMNSGTAWRYRAAVCSGNAAFLPLLKRTRLLCETHAIHFQARSLCVRRAAGPSRSPDTSS